MNSETFVWNVTGTVESFSDVRSIATIPVGATVVPIAATLSITALDPQCTSYSARFRGGTGGGGGIYWDFRFNSAGTQTSSIIGSPDTNDSGSAQTLFVLGSCSDLNGQVDDFAFGISGTFTFRVETPPTAFP